MNARTPPTAGTAASDPNATSTRSTGDRQAATDAASDSATMHGPTAGRDAAGPDRGRAEATGLPVARVRDPAAGGSVRPASDRGRPATECPVSGRIRDPRADPRRTVSVAIGPGWAIARARWIARDDPSTP